MTYFINGWREGENYFKRTLKSKGGTEADMERIMNGEEVTVGGTKFRVEDSMNYRYDPIACIMIPANDACSVEDADNKYIAKARELKKKGLSQLEIISELKEMGLTPLDAVKYYHAADKTLEEIAKGMTHDGSFKEGDTFKNKNGVVVKITGFATNGQIQYTVNGEAKGSTEGSLKNMLNANGYSKDERTVDKAIKSCDFAPVYGEIQKEYTESKNEYENKKKDYIKKWKNEYKKYSKSGKTEEAESIKIALYNFYNTSI